MVGGRYGWDKKWEKEREMSGGWGECGGGGVREKIKGVLKLFPLKFFPQHPLQHSSSPSFHLNITHIYNFTLHIPTISHPHKKLQFSHTSLIFFIPSNYQYIYTFSQKSHKNHHISPNHINFRTSNPTRPPKIHNQLSLIYIKNKYFTAKIQ